MPAGTFMRTIQERGRLIAGVDQTTLLFGYRDPGTGAIQGFDIDMLREVARAIFGSPDAIEFKAVTSAQRIPLAKDGTVDIVASLVTMNCARWQDVAFSSVYYLAHQEVLVRSGSGITGVADLDGKKVCATTGSTSIDNIQKIAPKAMPFAVPTRADCLVALQAGRVDAISTDDTILDGLHAQDPTTELLPQQLTDEPYGMAMSQGHPELVRFVNAVLDQIRRNGRWAEIDRRWLEGVGATQAPPQPRYRD
jgi:polar amino acid transport system substrate-binding protein